MLFLEQPADFNPRFHTAGCFVESDGAFLLLQRGAHKPQGGTWGLPAGKVEAGESETAAILRELAEETGLRFSADDMTYFRPAYARHSGYDVVFHMFRAQPAARPAITIDPRSHQDFCWATPEEALAMALMPDLAECVKLLYRV